MLLPILLLLLDGVASLEQNSTRSVFSFTTSVVTVQYNNSDVVTVEARYASGGPTGQVNGSLVLPPVHLSEDACQIVHNSFAAEQHSSNNIVLVRRGNCSFDQKVTNIMLLSDNNIAGIIIYNDIHDSELKNIFVSNSTVPVIFIKLEDGEELSESLEHGADISAVIRTDSYCEQSDDGLIKCIKYIENNVGNSTEITIRKH